MPPTRILWTCTRLFRLGRLLGGGEHLKIEVPALQIQNLVRARHRHPSAGKAEVLGVPLLHFERILADDAHVMKDGSGHGLSPFSPKRSVHVISERRVDSRLLYCPHMQCVIWPGTSSETTRSIRNGRSSARARSIAGITSSGFSTRTAATPIPSARRSKRMSGSPRSKDAGKSPSGRLRSRQYCWT